jgi:hypothetical protein
MLVGMSLRLSHNPSSKNSSASNVTGSSTRYSSLDSRPLQGKFNHESRSTTAKKRKEDSLGFLEGKAPNNGTCTTTVASTISNATISKEKDRRDPPCCTNDVWY